MGKDLVKQDNNVMKQGGVAGRGFENVDMEQISMPRVKIMQGLSPELQDEDYEFKMGDLVHGLLMEKLPEVFVPISIWDSRTMFVPRNTADKKKFFEDIKLPETDTMIVCRSLNGKNLDATFNAFNNSSCKDCKFKGFGWDGNPDTKPLCTHTINILALFEGQDMPVVIQFSNTNFKYGKRFRDSAFFSGGDLFSKMYKIKSKKEQNDMGTFFTTPVKPFGKVTEEETIKKVFDMYKLYSRVDIEVEDEINEKEEVTTEKGVEF